MLRNAIFLEIGPPPPHNANNIEHYTFVTLFSRKSDPPHPHLRYVTLEWPHNHITALVCGAETWALKKAQENKLEVAEMRMLRWMCGVTKLDKIRNERIRRTTKVRKNAKEFQERKLKWYGIMGM